MNRILLLLALGVAAAPAGAQARYLPQPDTLYYEALNPYRMYVVRGGDTLGGPIRSLTVERHVWRASDGGLAVQVRLDHPNDLSATTRDTLELNARGLVTAIPGSTDGSAGRWDFVLRLPGGELAPGTVWHDTLNTTGGSSPDNAFQVWRELRVERIADTLGSRVAIVRGTGTMRFRQTFGEEAGARWWMDVSGPVHETFLFDLEHGRMPAREWSMDLRGVAGVPAAGGAVDTIPAGLLSADTMRLITAERARLLLRGLPPGDSTETSGRMSFVHTVRREGQAIASGFARPDGMLTTVRATYRDGYMARYEMLSTEGLREPVRRTLVAEEGRLRMTGGRDTVLPLPEIPWAVADYAMEEHLAPALARLFRGGEQEGRIAVYRPYPMKWDTVQVFVRPVRDDVLFAAVRNGDSVYALFLESDGTLLYVEQMEPFTTQRRPRAGTREAKRVDALVNELLGGFKQP